MSLVFHIKPEIRILGIDDSALIRDNILIVGAFFRGGQWLDGVMRSEITRDGMDATDRIVEMVTSSKHYGQIRVIMLDGVTYGGFNPVDIVNLNKETGIPVIVLMREVPNFEKIKEALCHLPDADKRLQVIMRAGQVIKTTSKDPSNPVFIQCAGIEVCLACEIVRLSSTRGNVPEPLRVAHMIATGIVCGESRGQA
ncbi:endonuclease dU [Methanococcoides methylutens]|uniref:endonuclease dU n=1 Tax=Methanococcoides methylutens TaxID=2226 RepID=UPI0040443587